MIWLLVGCRPPVHIAYGPPSTLAVSAPATDARRMYVLDDAGRTWFFDTGYARTTCDDDLVTTLGLPTFGHVRVRGTSGSVRAAKADLPPLGFGGHVVSDLRCTVRDLPTTSSLGPGISGVLGMDVLRGFRLGLAPARGEVHLEAPPGSPLVGAAPFRPTRGHGFGAMLPLTYGDERLWALVDTGATTTCIDASRLRREVDEVGEVHVRGSGTSGGRVMSTWVARGVRVAGQPVPTLYVVSLPRPWHHPDLLGLDALGAFESTWDFDRREVVLTPVAVSESSGRL